MSPSCPVSVYQTRDVFFLWKAPRKRLSIVVSGVGLGGDTRGSLSVFLHDNSGYTIDSHSVQSTSPSTSRALMLKKMHSK